jgi:hypothetical protein
VLQLPGRWGHSVSSRSFHQLGLLYALIALLGGAYAAYDEVTAELERQRDVDYLSIFIPRLGFALIVAFVVYCIVRGGLSRFAASWYRPSGSTCSTVHHPKVICTINPGHNLWSLEIT